MTLEELIANAQIHQAIYRYCRGVDRGDEALIASAYHPGAQDHHGPFNGPVEAFAKRVVDRFDRPGVTGQHHVTNIYIELKGPATAAVESYFLAYRAQLNATTQEPELVPISGRYLDRFELRGDAWRIAERTVVFEWVRPPIPVSEFQKDHGFLLPGRREKDPSHLLFAS
jgi:hypothetical protein